MNSHSMLHRVMGTVSFSTEATKYRYRSHYKRVVEYGDNKPVL